MPTDTPWLELYVAKILGFQDLKDRFSDSLRAAMDTVNVDLFGSGGWLSTKCNLNGIGSGKFDVAADCNGYNGNGKKLAIDASEPEFQDVPYANSGATVYYVAFHYEEVPADAELGGDGSVNYAYLEEAIGEIVTPATVVDDGDETITLTLAASGVHAAWGTGTETRPVRVYLVNPETDGAEAFYDGTAAYSGGSITIETTHALGQSTISTTAADYRVMVYGPTIQTATMSADPEYLEAGTITSSVFDDTSADVFDDYATTALTLGTVQTELDTARTMAARVYGQQIVATLAQKEGLTHGSDYSIGFTLGGASINTNNVSGYVYLPVELPHGATVTDFQIHYQFDEGTGAAALCRFRLIRAARVPSGFGVGAGEYTRIHDGWYVDTNGDADTIDSWDNGDGTGGAWSGAGVEEVDRENYDYFIGVDLDVNSSDADAKLYSVSVFYTYKKIAPSSF